MTVVMTDFPEEGKFLIFARAAKNFPVDIIKTMPNSLETLVKDGIGI